MTKHHYKYHVFKESKLVIEVLSGTFSLSDYLVLKKSQLEVPDYDPDFNLILDIRNIDDTIPVETIRSYTEFVKPVQLFTRKIRAAVITGTPLQVTGALMYKMFEDKSLDYKVFSTWDHALSWVGVSRSELKNIDLE